MINVGRLAPVEQWDQAMLDDLFSNRLYPTGLEFRRHEGYPSQCDGAVLLCPGRYWSGHEDEITSAVARFKWLLLIVTGDEEAEFDTTEVAHPNCRFWIQTPRKVRDYPDVRFFGVGYTPHMRDLPTDPPTKDLDLFLSCQRTHIRREQAFEALKETPHHQRVEATAGFTQGMDVGEYAHCMTVAKVAPAPSGAVSPDSFRFWEALEAHTIPIADTVSPVDGETDYWRRLFPDAPFPILTDYDDLTGYIQDALKGWPANANRVTAWWMRTKRQYVHWLIEDLEALGAL